MNTQHWILLLLWVLYAALHSFLANDKVKLGIEKIAGSRFRYYRISYSMFALITLIIILWFQFSLDSIFLFSPGIASYCVSAVLIVPGFIIMIICIRKYFYDLSGIQALQKDKPVVTPVLRQDGLHNYVRHPLYFGTLLFVWGLWLLFPLLNNLIAAAVITVYVMIGIKLEETKLLLEYGEEYHRYSKRVPKLIPKIKM